MNDLMKSQGTRRFLAYCVAVVVLASIAGVALKIDTRPELVESVMWPIAFLAAGYLGFGMLHDGVVRKAIVTALGQKDTDTK